MRNRFEPPRGGHSTPSAARSLKSRASTAGVVAAAAAATLATGCGNGQAADPAQGRPTAPKTSLPQATTYTTLRGLPQDPDPSANADGTVVHPTAPVPISATPGGPPVAVLPDKQLGSPTWLPVVETEPGWLRVLLPSRPNGATGWLATDGGKLRTAHSSYGIKVDTSDRRLVILNSGRKVGVWTVAVGDTKTPTPTGRTFLLASLAPTRPTYSRLILPVGAHSATLNTFGGGPGTVAFHGWPQSSVFGKAVTHGCVRVPADALKELSRVPLGTPVVVTA